MLLRGISKNGATFNLLICHKLQVSDKGLVAGKAP